MNHRMGKRIQLAQPVMLDVTGLGKLNSQLKNISLSGAAVLCEEAHLLEIYVPVNLSLLVYDGEQPAVVSVEGFVVRLKGSLIGIMFMQDMIGLLQRLVNIRPKTPFPKENSLTKLSALFNRSEYHVRQLSKKASPKISERPSWHLSS